jgi:glycosyltransferase involved in cell wall biosynthesis
MTTLRADHDVAVACPENGPFAAEMARAGFQRFFIPAVEISFRLDPVHTPRGLAQFGSAGLALIRAARRFQPDLIHASTVRAGLIGSIATRVGGWPLVVRVHDHLPLNPPGRLVRMIIARSASEVVAVSSYTAERFNEGLRRPMAVHVYNGLDHARFDPDHVPPTALRAELGIAESVPLLGQIAQITPWKGQDTAIRALAELRRGGLDAHLAIVGGVMFAGRHVRYDNHGYLNELHRLVDELSIGNAVHFVGQREDVPAVLRSLDLFVLPSWEEPFALAVMESMAMGTPALVGSVGGAPEVLEDGITARVLPPKQPQLWAEAARELIADEEGRRRMGVLARGVAARFRDETHADDMLAVYDRVLDGSARRRSRAHTAR